MAGLILTSSGKGGVGKTTICAHLGAALARRGLRVLLVETDAGFRALDILFALEATIVYDLADLLEGRCAHRQAVITHSATGLDLIPATADPGYLPGDERVAELCRWASRTYDYVIFDGAGGFGPMQAMLARRCTLALIVTLAETAAVRGGARVSGLLRGRGLLSQRLIINRVPNELPSAFGNTIRDLDDVIDTVGAQLIGVVPDELLLKPPGQTVGQTPAGQELDRIARRMLGEYVDLVVY